MRVTGPASGSEHIGRNVFDHFNLDQTFLNTRPLAEMVLTILTTPALPTLACDTHGDRCLLGTAELDVSGFPCNDWSPSGLQQGIFGAYFGVLVALVQWHRCKRTKIIILENVPEFDESVLRHLMSDLWDIHFFYISPSDVGCAYLSRMRVFILCLLRGFNSGPISAKQ